MCGGRDLAARWESARDGDAERRESWSRSLKALALGHLDRRDEAVGLLEDELARSRHWGAPGALGRSLRLLGMIQREQGIDLLREAVNLTDGSTARLEHAKTLIALGSALRRSRQVELVTRCELASRFRIAVAPRGSRIMLARSCTRPAAGQTNRDIAQVLYITPKTVEVHLTNVYRKLGIRARAGPADALGRTDQP